MATRRDSVRASRGDLGRAGETAAARYLERRGLVILERNLRSRLGEIDLLARDGQTLVFVEVKARRAGGAHPWENLDQRKRLQVRRMASAWLAEAEHKYYAALRFDAVAVVVDRDDRLVSLEHMEGAF